MTFLDGKPWEILAAEVELEAQKIYGDRLSKISSESGLLKADRNNRFTFWWAVACASRYKSEGVTLDVIRELSLKYNGAARWKNRNL